MEPSRGVRNGVAHPLRPGRSRHIPGDGVDPPRHRGRVLDSVAGPLVSRPMERNDFHPDPTAAPYFTGHLALTHGRPSRKSDQLSSLVTPG